MSSLVGARDGEVPTAVVGRDVALEAPIPLHLLQSGAPCDVEFPAVVATSQHFCNVPAVILDVEQDLAILIGE